MRSFASDNNSGVHPLVMDAVIKANDNHAVGYGDDPWTVAATAKIKEVFGEMEGTEKGILLRFNPNL